MFKVLTVLREKERLPRVGINEMYCLKMSKDVGSILLIVQHGGLVEWNAF